MAGGMQEQGFPKEKERNKIVARGTTGGGPAGGDGSVTLVWRE